MAPDDTRAAPLAPLAPLAPTAPRGGGGGVGELLASLNAAQRRAVTTAADTVAILAGPGSGKTHTLASRVVWLIDHVGHRPEDVVVATFTVKAAREMKERIGRMLGGDRGRRVVLGTFHSIARRYLAAYGRHVGLGARFGIADDGDSRAVIQRICKRMGTAVDPAAARAWISKKKARGTGEAAAPPPKKSGTQQQQQPTEMQRDLEAIFDEYQDQLRLSNLLDYDDLLVRCVELLGRHPSCVANVQAVLIDEYQDTNGVQYELMKLLAQQRQRITVVGDPDQCIYAWRSAEVRNLYRLLREFPDTDEVALEDNYRSSRAILALSLAVIQEDKKRYQKVLRPVRERGSRPVLRKLRSANAEGEWVVAEIGRVMRMTGGMVRPQDVAILLRSAALSRPIESALGKAGIAYRMVGGSKFYDRVEVKIVLDYLRVIHQPDNNDAVARILNVPRRGIGDITIKNLVEEAEHARLSLWGLLTKHCRGDRTAKTTIKKAVEQKLSGDLIKTINAARKTIDGGGGGDTGYDLVALVDSLVAQLRLQKYLEDNYPDDHENRWANVREFVTLAGDFARDLAAQGDEDSLPSVDGLAQAADADVLARFLANVSLASDAQTRGGGANDEKTDAVVTISTIHAAKGLEWPVVFVPAVYVGSFPHARSEDHDEERRLLYVAMTRAKAALYLSWPLYAGGPAGGSGQKAELSPFLPPPVVAQFAKKGPLLEKSVVEDMARVLGRDVPAQVDVFAKMPLNAALDDCLFPIDPEENKRERRPWPGKGGGGGGGGGGGDGEEGDAADSSLPPAKRHRTTGGREFAGLDVEFLGEGECLMTMERASEFTFASARARMPGFTTATAHKQALDAAAKAAKAAGAAGAGATAARTLSGGSLGGRPTGPGSRTRLAPDQKTLSGFVRQASGGPPQRTTAAHPPPPQRTPSLPTLRASASNTRTAHPLPQPPAIDPSLAKHRLARGPALPRPPTATKMSKEEEDAEEAALRRSQYAFLSSSPPRPKKEEGGEGGKGKDGDDGEPPLSPAEPSRPLACLHVTTTMMSARERAPQGRPPRPLVPARPSPVERVRKPFKPLTINK